VFVAGPPKRRQHVRIGMAFQTPSFAALAQHRDNVMLPAQDRPTSSRKFAQKRKSEDRDRVEASHGARWAGVVSARKFPGMSCGMQQRLLCAGR